LSLIVGELVPKRIALNNAEAIAARIAPPMALLARAGAPLVGLLRVSTEAVLRLLRVTPSTAPAVTEEEVRSLIAEGTEAGVFHAAERDMIDGVLRLADRPVRSVMTPRPDVVWLDPADPPEELRREIAGSGHSRFPVSRGRIDDVEGVVHAKDVLDRIVAAAAGREPFDLRACIRQPLIVHDGTPVLRLLELFRRSPVHMAVVVDEYGSFEGLVTPTDILTAIAGDLPEHATGVEEPDAVRREDGSWLLDGMIGLDDAERLLGRRGMKDGHGYHTLAGFVLWQLGHVPAVGERFEWNGLRFEVIDMDGRRIDRVLVAEAVPAPAGPVDAAATPD
ncbi:MAG TPA: hemolysin family protein, partial [Geminicoccaceae bacterium]|nr:hemolysin family protein [Geminicoccaceae bacterium]